MSVNSTAAYAALRGCNPELTTQSCSQEQAAIVVLNFENSPQTLFVQLPKGLRAQVSEDLLTGEDGPATLNADSAPYFQVTLPPLGFGLYSVQVGGEPELTPVLQI